ncbi:leucyl aminopeptidase [Galbitalea sp. SE-J8]|uniref:leucyl aminopeptidase n=1 Tax=Galbitalea sp. SE-J8 TaxID=3054952 RepID=UPI00259D09FE|nr:leucyl aminopeptidase [Galbitalea sp. SE-J8]MDM4763184.1 leucyl aminopeptidase [Galbitalea sp. SE-J8]
MAVPALSVTPSAPTEIAADVLVVGVLKTDDGPRLSTDDPALVAAAGDLGAIGVTGGADEVRRLPLTGAAARSLALVGLGSPAPDANALRAAAGAATRQLLGVESVALVLPLSDLADLAAALEGAAIGAYAYTALRSTSLGATKLPAASVIVASELDGEPALARAAAIGEATHLVRDLVNTPPSELYPETLAARAVELGEAAADVRVEVLDEHALAAGGYGGILGVGSGSVRPPRLAKVVYSSTGAERHLAIVGKGITFDTGGLSLKPPTGMIGMKYDMTGAATALAVVLAASALRLPVRVTAWMCIAENMPSGSAMRPNDVLRIVDGTTVENLNSDAEGRLVMADGLAAASAERPDVLVDIATLTGAARVALGNRYVGVMGETGLVRRVIEIADAAGEPFWHMPLPGDLRALLNSDVADIANVKPGNTAGGMLVAGVFLREFVGRVSDEPDAPRIPWAHLDIAGPANNDGGGFGYTGKGPTAIALRTLVDLAADLAERPVAAPESPSAA